MSAFVVRSDVNVRPAWLGWKADPNFYRGSLCMYDVFEEAWRARVFEDFKQAQMVADDWSDFPGVWRVVVRPRTMFNVPNQSIIRWEARE